MNSNIDSNNTNGTMRSIAKLLVEQAEDDLTDLALADGPSIPIQEKIENKSRVGKVRGVRAVGDDRN
jgi:hypothetical protein